MYVCMYVCMYIYGVYIYIYIRIYVHIMAINYSETPWIMVDIAIAVGVSQKNTHN